MDVTKVEFDGRPEGGATKPDPAVFRRDLRKIILELSKSANVGHVGSCLGIADILTVLFTRVLNIPRANDPERDRFILSKGHAALALYGALYLAGLISQEDLNTFHCESTLLGVHPEHSLPGVDFSTGSLGHGLSYGAGAAFAARLQGSERNIFVLVSDAECNEGSLWEAVMFAAHHRLGRLTAIVDADGQQALGHTREVIDLDPLADRWRAFGWNVAEVDGHDIDRLEQVLNLEKLPDGDPRVLIARTQFGGGVSFMKGEIKWHYLPLSEEDYKVALDEVAHLS